MVHRQDHQMVDEIGRSKTEINLANNIQQPVGHESKRLDLHRTKRSLVLCIDDEHMYEAVAEVGNG